MTVRHDASSAASSRQQRCSPGSGTGAAAMRRRVYGSFGWVSTSCLGPCSTTVPWLITAMRSDRRLDHREVVADEQAGEAQALLELEDEVEQARLHGDVQGGARRLVRDQQLGVRGEGPSDGDALTLATGELVGEAVSPGGGRLDAFEEPAHAGVQHRASARPVGVDEHRDLGTGPVHAPRDLRAPRRRTSPTVGLLRLVSGARATLTTPPTSRGGGHPSPALTTQPNRGITWYTTPPDLTAWCLTRAEAMKESHAEEPNLGHRSRPRSESRHRGPGRRQPAERRARRGARVHPAASGGAVEPGAGGTGQEEHGQRGERRRADRQRPVVLSTAVSPGGLCGTTGGMCCACGYRSRTARSRV